MGKITGVPLNVKILHTFFIFSRNGQMFCVILVPSLDNVDKSLSGGGIYLKGVLLLE
jgi:hypothetical protein